MRRLFSIPDDKEVRLWNRYMSNTFEHLNKKDITLQEAGLYQGQVCYFIFYLKYMGAYIVFAVVF